jgi:hypothetical protein
MLQVIEFSVLARGWPRAGTLSRIHIIMHAGCEKQLGLRDLCANIDALVLQPPGRRSGRRIFMHTTIDVLRWLSVSIAS